MSTRVIATCGMISVANSLSVLGSAPFLARPSSSAPDDSRPLVPPWCRPCQRKRAIVVLHPVANQAKNAVPEADACLWPRSFKRGSRGWPQPGQPEAATSSSPLLLAQPASPAPGLAVAGSPCATQPSPMGLVETKNTHTTTTRHCTNTKLTTTPKITTPRNSPGSGCAARAWLGGVFAKTLRAELRPSGRLGGFSGGARECMPELLSFLPSSIRCLAGSTAFVAPGLSDRSGSRIVS